MAAWRAVLCDKAGVPSGQLQAFSAVWSTGISRPATFSCRVREEDPLFTSIDAGTNYLKVYDSQGLLRFYGRVVTFDEQGDGTTTSAVINAIDEVWNLNTHFIATDGNPRSFPIAGATTTDAVARNVLTAAQSDSCSGALGLGTSVAAATVSPVTYTFKKTLDIINEMAALPGSFEYAVSYTEPSGPNVVPVCKFDTPARLGTDKSASVFLEYGPGEKTNCAKYQRVRSIEHQANWVFCVGSGGADTPGSVKDTPSPSFSTYGIYRMDVVSFPNVGNNAHYQAQAQAEVNARKNTKETDVLTSSEIGGLVYGVDYVLGDTIHARIVIGGLAAPKLRTNASVRIFNVDVQIMDNGNEVPVFALQ